MSTTTLTDRFVTIEVFDPNRHKSVLLEGLRSSASMAEVKARAMAGLHLESGVDWNVRHDQTARLLLDDQRLGELIGEGGTQLSLTMQPDAGLG